VIRLTGTVRAIKKCTKNLHSPFYSQGSVPPGLVDGDDLKVAKPRHHDGFRSARLSRKEDIASAIHVYEQFGLVCGRNNIGRHNIYSCAINGVRFDRDVEALSHGGECLDRFGCLLIRGFTPLFAYLPR